MSRNEYLSLHRTPIPISDFKRSTIFRFPDSRQIRPHCLRAHRQGFLKDQSPDLNTHAHLNLTSPAVKSAGLCFITTDNPQRTPSASPTQWTTTFDSCAANISNSSNPRPSHSQPLPPSSTPPTSNPPSIAPSSPPLLSPTLRQSATPPAY